MKRLKSKVKLGLKGIFWIWQIINECYGLNVFSAKIHMLKPNSQCDIKRRWLSQEDPALMGGLVPLLKKPKGACLPPSSCEDTDRRRCYLWNRVMSFTRHQIYCYWSWTFPPLELWAINFCCLQIAQSKQQNRTMNDRDKKCFILVWGIGMTL